MINEVIETIKAYTDGKDNAGKVEISVMQLNRIIKALEQQPTDAISRQAVIDTIDKWVKSMHVLIALPANEVTPLFESVHELSPVTPQPNKWIPCSERLPEVGGEVLVCYDFKGKRSVYIADFYGDGKFHGLDDEYLTTEGRKYRKAVAWMPLPEPYLPDIYVGNMSEIPTGAEGRDKE